MVYCSHKFLLIDGWFKNFFKPPLFINIKTVTEFRDRLLDCRVVLIRKNRIERQALRIKAGCSDLHLLYVQKLKQKATGYEHTRDREN